MKNLLTTIAFALGVVLAYGQQEYSFTHYFETNSFFNPAATAFKGTQDLGFVFRSQWTGFEGAPFSSGLTYERPIANYNMGVGGYAFVDVIGATTMTTVGGNYAYQLKLDQTHKMAFGVTAGADVYSTDYNRLTYWDSDVMFDDQTPTTVTPRLGAGVQFYTDAYYVGVSMPRIAHFNTTSPLSIAAASMPQIVSNLYVTGGYNFPVSEEVEMQINMLGKYTRNVIPQGDINVMATYKEMIGLGLGYKSLGFASTYLHYTYQNILKIGYAFDFTLTPMANYSSGSHELMLKYTIPMKEAGRSSMQ